MLYSSVGGRNANGQQNASQIHYVRNDDVLMYATSSIEAIAPINAKSSEGDLVLADAGGVSL